VDSKFGNLWGGWCSLELVSAFGVGLWKNIKKGGRLSLVLLDLRWGMGLRHNFGTIHGAVIQF
jgi:hypothetical protein